MKDAIWWSLARIQFRCGQILNKVYREAERVKREESYYVQNIVLPILDQLSDVLEKVIAGINPKSNATILLYFYPLPNGRTGVPPGGVSGPGGWFGYSWIDINNTQANGDPVIITSSQIDPILFHELTHYFANTIDQYAAGPDENIMNIAENLQAVYENVDPLGIGGGYAVALNKARMEAGETPWREYLKKYPQ
jgi:hypothetical protein